MWLCSQHLSLLLCVKHFCHCRADFDLFIFIYCWGRGQQVNIKSTVVDSVKCWECLCLPTVLSISCLDNTVNSNQDPVISNYRPLATRELGRRQVRNWQVWAVAYLHFLVCRSSWAPALLEKSAQQVTGLHWVTTCPTTGETVAHRSTKSLLTPLSLHCTAQAGTYCFKHHYTWNKIIAWKIVMSHGKSL